MIAGEVLELEKSTLERKASSFLSAFKIIRKNKVSWMYAMDGSAIF